MGDFWGSGKGRPTNTDESMDMIAKSLRGFMPASMETIRSQYEPFAATETDIAKKYTPEIAQLQLDTMSNQGRGMAELGRELSDKEQKGAAQTEADIMAGAGGDAARTALKLQNEADPEAAAQRAALSQHLNEAFDALGTPGQLSPGEQEQISRQLGRNSWAMGSPVQDYNSAMEFGDAAAKRRSEWTGLLQTSIAAQPALKSGVDMAAQAHTRNVMPNWALGQYTGVQTPGVQSANQQTGNYLSGMFGVENTSKNKAESTADAQLKYTQSLSNIASAAGSFAGMCWVARAVYGTTDNRWMLFRKWLLSKSPLWVWYLYLEHGPAVAGIVERSPLVKNTVKFFMDFIVKGK